MERIISNVVLSILFPEVPIKNKKEKLSKEFKTKFGRLYAEDMASYRDIYDKWDRGPGYPSDLADGEEALNYLQWFKERLQEEGALVLNRWLEIICDAEEEGPRNYWASVTLKQIAFLCLEELGVNDPWCYRHAALKFYDEFRDGEVYDDFEYITDREDRYNYTFKGKCYY